MSSSDSNQCHLVISTCDSYRDAWNPFFQLFFRYWPDCPFPITLISESKTYDHPRVNSLVLGEDRGWASNLKQALDTLDCKQILYMQEDYFLEKQVDTRRLQSVFNYARTADIGYIRLAGAPVPRHQHDNPFGLGELDPNQKSRCSLQAAWWNVETLRKLMVDGENGWQMEIQGSQRSSQLSETFLSVYPTAPLIPYYYYTAILKGKWVPGALRLCRREKVEVDTSHRPIHAEWPILMKSIRHSKTVDILRRMTGRRSRLTG